MAKKRHHISSSIKSFFESHTDPAKHEKLKATRKGMEEKKNEILSIVLNEEAKDGSRRGPLADLIEDFHKQYESLYAHYDHLTGELKNKGHKHRNGKENSSSSSDSDSDSDSEHSHKENDNKNGKLDDERFRATDNLQQELEAAKFEVTLLGNKLEVVCSEKDTLESAYEAIIRKLEGTERTLEDLKAETEILKSEKLNLVGEKEDLKSKVEDSFKAEVDLRQKIAELIREKDDLSQEKEDSVRRIEEGNQNVDDLKAEVEQLQGDKQSLEVQLETINQDFSQLKQETVNLNESMKAVQEENKTVSLKLSDITDELLRAQETIEEFEAESISRKEKLAEREIEFSSLKQMHDAHKTVTLEQIKALEKENSSLKLKLDIVMGEKRDIEEKFEFEVTELREQISEVEMLLKKREDQFSSLQEKLGNTEKESNSQIEGLAKKVDVLSLELDELQAEKSKLEKQIKVLQEGIIPLQVHDREMKLELERKTEDIAEYLIQIQGLHEKLSSSDKFLKEYFHEKENLSAKLKDFELEVEKLETHKAGLEDETRIKSDEATRLREEIQRLEDGIVELEKVVQNKEEKCATMQRRLEHQEIESSLKISTFGTEIDTLNLELEAIRRIKSELEGQTEMTKQEYSESLKLLELQNIELKNKTEELKDALSQKREEYEQLEDDFRESKADLEAAQSQIEELTIISESKDESTVELAGTIEDLQRDKEAAKDDAVTALEKTHTIEVRFRLANQKLRVTEQLLAEKEDDFRIAEKRYREECKLLENKLTANDKAYRGMIMNLSKNMNNFVAEMESITKKFEEDNEKFSRRIYNMSEELLILKHCMAGKNIEKEQLEQQLTNLGEKLQTEREYGLLMRQNLSELEVQAVNAKGENKILQSRYSELKSIVTILGDEKREAIRQLCVWSDDLHSRYNELKNIIAKSSLRRR